MSLHAIEKRTVGLARIFCVFVGGVQKLRWLENFEWGNEIPRRTANSSSASASVTRGGSNRGVF
jgi:hypothetical protein